MEVEGILPRSLESVTGPEYEPVEPSPHPSQFPSDLFSVLSFPQRRRLPSVYFTSSLPLQRDCLRSPFSPMLLRTKIATCCHLLFRSSIRFLDSCSCALFLWRRGGNRF